MPSFQSIQSTAFMHRFGLLPQTAGMSHIRQIFPLASAYKAFTLGCEALNPTLYRPADFLAYFSMVITLRGLKYKLLRKGQENTRHPFAEDVGLSINRHKHFIFHRAVVCSVTLRVRVRMI